MYPIFRYSRTILSTGTLIMYFSASCLFFPNFMQVSTNGSYPIGDFLLFVSSFQISCRFQQTVHILLVIFCFLQIFPTLPNLVQHQVHVSLSTSTAHLGLQNLFSRFLLDVDDLGRLTGTMYR